MNWQLSVTVYGCGEGKQVETWPLQIETGELMMAKTSWRLSKPAFAPWRVMQEIEGCQVSLIYDDESYQLTVVGESPDGVKNITERIDRQLELPFNVYKTDQDGNLLWSPEAMNRALLDLMMNLMKKNN